MNEKLIPMLSKDKILIAHHGRDKEIRTIHAQFFGKSSSPPKVRLSKVSISPRCGDSSLQRQPTRSVVQFQNFLWELTRGLFEKDIFCMGGLFGTIYCYARYDKFTITKSYQQK